MSDLNITIITGNLGRDPEMKFISNGSATTSFSVAVSSGYKDKDSGEWKVNTDWVNVVTWNKLAEKCNQELSKGTSVFVQGKIKTRSWDGQDGKKQYRTELIADKVLPMAKKETQESTDGGVSSSDELQI